MSDANFSSEFKELAQKVFDLSGEYDSEVHFTAGSQALTRFANNIIHQNVSTESSSLNIRLQKGSKTGSVNINLPAGDETLRRAVESCKEVVEHSKDTPDLLPMLGKQEYRKTDGFCPDTASISPRRRAEIVLDTVEACRGQNLSAAGIVQNYATYIGIANSKGLFAFWRGTGFNFSLTVEGDDGTGWAESSAWKFADVNVNDDIAEAIEIAKRNQKPEDIEPGRYTVVLTPAAVGDLLVFLAWHGFNARAHLENRSFLAGKMGQKVFDERITIIDDAYDPRWQGLPFDMEGVPRERVELIREGVLVGLVYDRLTAEKMNASPTGHGGRQPNTWGAFPSCIVVAPGNATMEEMIKSVKNGLLVTHFHYTNTSELTKLTVTGMTRDGLFKIENGEIVYPVKNLRFTQSIAEALNRVVAVGSEQKRVSGFFFGGIITPGMIIDEFNFSSATEFGG